MTLFAHAVPPVLTLLSFLFVRITDVDNFCGLAVSKSLSAMHRVLIDSCTTALVWVVDTILFYATRQNDTPYGERWNAWSPLQLAGFAIMIWGTSTYYGVLRYPCLMYPSVAPARG
jgi:hypothetical protein